MWNVSSFSAAPIVACTALAATSWAADNPDWRFRWRWVQAGVNFQTDQDVDRFMELMRRAQKAGYNGILFSDGKLSRPVKERPPRYWRNVERVDKLAAELDIELIPKVANVSWGNSILSNNPNLAEGVPVRDCEFQVKDGQATVADQRNLLPFGSFEEFDHGDRPRGWDFVDGPGKSMFQDRKVKHAGESSVRMEKFQAGSKYGLSRLYKKLKLEPWRQYELSLWIKTENVARPHTIRVMLHTDVNERARHELNRQYLGVRSTQDWRQHHVLFNTLGRSDVWVYVGSWGAEEGTIWIDDVRLREVAGINMLRRKGCPIRVTSEDGKTVYEEDRDFECWEYPQMGRVPYSGRYAVSHPEPPIVLAANSRIRDRQRLKVSFYHTLLILDGVATCCMRSDSIHEQYERQVRLIKRVFPRTKTWLINEDEVRLAGWCELCNSPDLNAGQILAENVQRIAKMIRRIEPDAVLVTWSDMFDPHHNAVDRYWLTRNTMKGSWEGLDRNMVISNWNQGRRDASLKWFADRGHRQIIATYYDRFNWQKVTTDWLRSAEKVDGIEGIIYATWRNDYDHLEEFMELVGGFEEVRQ